MKLLIGLGNKGDLYQKTIHNMGFLYLDQISQIRSLVWTQKHKLKSFLAFSKNYILCKANNFMNLSGESIALVSNYYKILPNNILVFHDDIDINFSDLKFKFGGGNAGHNGLKSLDQYLRSCDYFRLRLGVGKPPNMDISKYVLSNFTPEQLIKIEKKVIALEKFLDLFLNNEVELFKQKISHLNLE
ncbi:MAG: aminoacyl-tRNA hydrolase [Rickettsia sp.]|nr:aminoacyl-tRNA hydrolase [Rickettsia sp.]